MTSTSAPLLLLHATAGAGHTRAAQAVSAALKLHDGSPGHPVVDTLECTGNLARKGIVVVAGRNAELMASMRRHAERIARPQAAADAAKRLQQALA